CLVDRHQGRRHDLEQAAELVARERLRRGEDQQRAALRDARQALAAIRDPDRAVEAYGRHAELLHLQILVLEEREERRDHHRGLGQEQRRELVAQRLASAGWHDEQRVAASEDRRDGTLLLAIEARDPEALARRTTDVVETDRGRGLQVCAFQGLHRAPVRWRPGPSRPGGPASRGPWASSPRAVSACASLARGWASERVAYALGPDSVLRVPHRRGKIHPPPTLRPQRNKSIAAIAASEMPADATPMATFPALVASLAASLFG